MSRTNVYTVERIVDERVRGGQREFLIKWEGFPSSANTWEAEENVLDKSVIRDFRRERTRSPAASPRRSRAAAAASTPASQRRAPAAAATPVPPSPPRRLSASPSRATRNSSAAAAAAAVTAELASALAPASPRRRGASPSPARRTRGAAAAAAAAPAETRLRQTTPRPPPPSPSPAASASPARHSKPSRPSDVHLPADYSGLTRSAALSVALTAGAFAIAYFNSSGEAYARLLARLPAWLPLPHTPASQAWAFVLALVCVLLAHLAIASWVALHREAAGDAPHFALRVSQIVVHAVAAAAAQVHAAAAASSGSHAVPVSFVLVALANALATLLQHRQALSHTQLVAEALNAVFFSAALTCPAAGGEALAAALYQSSVLRGLMSFFLSFALVVRRDSAAFDIAAGLFFLAATVGVAYVGAALFAARPLLIAAAATTFLAASAIADALHFHVAAAR